MNNDFDDFSDVIDNIIVDKDKTDFKIHQLKIEHFHWAYDDIYHGMPISTSVELTCNYNYEKEKLVWKKTVSHTYLSLEHDQKYSIDIYEEEISNYDDLIKSIEKYDLRELKNNYFTEDRPEEFTHWELTYNNYFKIVGTYDQSVYQFEKISELLEFKSIIKKEVKKIREKVENM